MSSGEPVSSGGGGYSYTTARGFAQKGKGNGGSQFDTVETMQRSGYCSAQTGISSRNLEPWTLLDMFNVHFLPAH